MPRWSKAPAGPASEVAAQMALKSLSWLPDSSRRMAEKSGCLSDSTKVATSDGRKPCRARDVEMSCNEVANRAPSSRGDVAGPLLLKAAATVLKSAQQFVSAFVSQIQIQNNAIRDGSLAVERFFQIDARPARGDPGVDLLKSQRLSGTRGKLEVPWLIFHQ